MVLPAWLRVFLAIALAALALAVMRSAVGHSRLLEKERGLDRAWGAILLPFDKVEQSFPRSDRNSAAAALEKEAARLGVDLAPDKAAIPDADRKESRPSEQAREELANVGEPLWKWLILELERSSDEILPPPVPVLDFLSRHAGDLASVCRRALAGEGPRWELNPRKGEFQAFPNTAGLKTVHELLLAAALSAEQSADPGAASEYLEASWRLNEAMSARPELALQADAVWIARLQAAALRKADPGGAKWVSSFLARDFLRATLISIEYEAFTASSMVPFARGNPGLFASLPCKSSSSDCGSRP